MESRISTTLSAEESRFQHFFVVDVKDIVAIMFWEGSLKIIFTAGNELLLYHEVNDENTEALNKLHNTWLHCEKSA